MTAELPVKALQHRYEMDGPTVRPQSSTIDTRVVGRRGVLSLWVALGAAIALAAGCGGSDDDAPAGGGGGGGTVSWSVSGTPPTQVMVGQAFSFTPTVTNPNNVTLTFNYSNLPGWASANSANGAISGTPGAGDVATYSNIRLTVTDGTNTYTSPAYSIQVVATSSGSVTLSWMPPTTKTDGTTLTIGGYRVYFGTSPGSYPNVRSVPAGVTSFVVDQLTPGNYNFVMTALEQGTNVESLYSNVATKVVN
jgi:hypothetical protein